MSGPFPKTAAAGRTDASAELDRIGALVEAAFREAVARAIRQAHAAGVPTVSLDAQGGLVWRYADGSERTAREAIRNSLGT